MLWDEHPKGWKKLPIDLKLRELEKVYTDKVLNDALKEAISTIEQLQDYLNLLHSERKYMGDYT